MVNDELPAVSAVEAFRRYTQAFQALDPRAVARHFHQPALMITRERVIALPSGAAVEEADGRVMARLPALGFVRTEFPSLAERRLGDDLAVVTGVSVWKDASGSDLQRFGLTYTLRRTGGDWRIVVAAIHEPELAP